MTSEGPFYDDKDEPEQEAREPFAKNVSQGSDSPEVVDDEAVEAELIEELEHDLSKSIVEVEKQRDEYLDALRRLQAEFENFRKRTMRQQTELLERATLSLVERLLPVVDALDLALAHAESQSDAASPRDLHEALVQIAGLLRTTLEKEGLERIDETDVAFDPTIHDAVSRVDVSSGEKHEQTVVEVMRAGYRLKGRVIRPAMVAVTA